jgi:serine/threonine protein kinase
VIRSPQPGDLLGDRYRVIEVVGSGGMGVVYRAQNIVTEKYVALKWMHPRFASGTGGDRLLREARAASLLKHPHIVDVYDLTKDTVSDTWVLVMELLQGETLREYMQRSGQAKLSTFIAQLLPAMGAVVAAHELGIVHRDLKPENIFLERVPSANRVVPKVLDFGIAKLSRPDGPTLTATGTTLGTPFYMSPEQYRGDKDIDARTDVYAFGAMLYEAITGQMPHAASSLPELALKVTTVDAASVKSLCPAVPSALARLVDWSLARRREDRIPSLKQLHDELDLFAREHSFRAEMTLANASTPLLAAAQGTAATSAETQLGVRLYDVSPSDKTPAPSARTHHRTRGPAESGYNWIAWSLLALTLALFGWREQRAGRSLHAEAQPISAPVESPAELASLMEASAPAARSGDVHVCADAQPSSALPRDPEVLALIEASGTPLTAASDATPLDHKAAAAQRPLPVRGKLVGKVAPVPVMEASPSPPRDTPARPDPKRSISKLLAF